MGRGWYRRRHVDRDVAGILAQTQAAELTLHILRGCCAARPTARPSSRMRRQPYVARPSATVLSFRGCMQPRLPRQREGALIWERGHESRATQ
jgi:hypothetical protein